MLQLRMVVSGVFAARSWSRMECGRGRLSHRFVSGMLMKVAKKLLLCQHLDSGLVFGYTAKYDQMEE